MKHSSNYCSNSKHTNKLTYPDGCIHAKPNNHCTIIIIALNIIPTDKSCGRVISMTFITVL